MFFTHVLSSQESRARINNSMDNATEPFPGKTNIKEAKTKTHTKRQKDKKTKGKKDKRQKRQKAKKT